LRGCLRDCILSVIPQPVRSVINNLRPLVNYICCQWAHYAGGTVFLLVTNGFALLIPWFMKLAVEALQHPETARFSATHCAFVIILLAVAHCLTRILSRTLILNAARLIEFRMREDLFSRLLLQDQLFFHTSRTGDILSRFSNDLTNVRMLTGFGLLSSANAVIVYIAAIALMMRINPWLTVYAVMPFPLMVIVVRVISRRMFSRSLEAQEELGQLTSLAEESISSVRLIKAYCREEYFQQKFSQVSRSYLKLNLDMAKLRGLIMPVMALATGAGTLVVLFAGGRMVIGGEITLGDFVAFSGYLAMLVWPTVMMGWILTMAQRGASSMARINGVLAAVPQVGDQQDAQDLDVIRQGIELRNLTFSHGDGEVLKGISLWINAGERIGITGDVGSGKTTLCRLLMRLLPVPDGQILIDGVDINRIRLASLRAQIGYVPQEAFLFSRTIRENIAYGGGDSLMELEAAARKAGFSADVEKFGERLDTLVGERGVALSGGQKQRLSIARALVAGQPILLLDDPLSAVDAGKEEEILTALGGVFADRTVLVISHRMSVFRDCDRIVVLQGGRIAECGSAEELLAAGGLYAEMCLKQGLGIGG